MKILDALAPFRTRSLANGEALRRSTMARTLSGRMVCTNDCPVDTVEVRDVYYVYLPLVVRE
jgi:hypothetical protein